MESVKLDPKTIDAIARKSATYVLNGLKKKKNNDKEMVTAAEAARILGISQSYLRVKSTEHTDKWALCLTLITLSLVILIIIQET